MATIRIISRLDIKGNSLIKGVNLEGLRVIGDPHSFALDYYSQGIDELMLHDCVASLFGRNNLHDIVKQISNEIFVPITVGGGVRTLEDVYTLLRCGADKVSINTAAIRDPKFITRVAHEFGSQCMVLSIEAKQQSPNKWEAYTDNGREKTGLDVIKWAREAEELGAGEIILTSVDTEGTKKGFDIDLLKAVTKNINIPIIASGGMGAPQDLVLAVQEGGVSAVAIANIIHYKKYTIGQIRNYAIKHDLNLREIM